MFGIGKKTDQPDRQLPYEVYETVQEQSAPWRRWLVRLVAALAIVTLLVFGGIALRNALRDDNPSQPASQPGQGGTQDSQGGGSQNPPSPQQGAQPQPPAQPPAPVQPSPQPNPPLPNTGSDTSPQSGTTNNSTVRKPE